MELLEREHFFTELEGLLGAVAAGNGRLALIGGEAGIGKTSLVERFADAHKAKARVLWGSCDALLTPRPLGPFYDIAQQTQGRLLALLEEEAATMKSGFGCKRLGLSSGELEVVHGQNADSESTAQPLFKGLKRNS